LGGPFRQKNYIQIQKGDLIMAIREKLVFYSVGLILVMGSSCPISNAVTIEIPRIASTIEIPLEIPIEMKNVFERQEAYASRFTKKGNPKVYGGQCIPEESGRSFGKWSSDCLACQNKARPEYVNVINSRRVLASDIGFWDGDQFVTGQRRYNWLGAHYLADPKPDMRRAICYAFVKTQIESNIANEEIRLVALKKAQQEQRMSLVLRLVLDWGAPVI
jgi:hypothetical protein